MSAFDDLTKRLVDHGLDRWHSRTGLAVVLLGIFVIAVAIFAGIDISNVSLLEWGVIAALLIAVYAAWIRTRIERVRKGRIGFGVAIEFEDSEHAKRLRADFVVTLRDLLNGSKHRHQFQFIEFAQSIAQRIEDHDQASWLARKSGVHFLIYGRARQRLVGQNQSHILDMRWLVRHRSIEPERSKKFAEDAGTVVPKRLIVGGPNEPFGLEFAAQHIEVAARYVIGTASALSNDFVYAEQLLKDAEAKVLAFAKRSNASVTSVLLDRVQKRIDELYSAWLAGLSEQYKIKRQKDLLEQSEKIVKKLRLYKPDDYAAHLTSAMAAFLLRRDVVAARQELDACRKVKDATWIYSEAFLLAYDGDLEGAYRAYRRAFEAPLQDASLPTQCEEFIQIVIDEEPERTWLYYCLGLINRRGKDDLRAAREDFKRFIEGADSVRFGKFIGIAEKWLDEIDSELGGR